MQKVFLILISVMGFLYARSQDFLVKHSGDTLRGNIQFSGKTISVLQPNGTNTTYFADDIEYINTPRLKGTVLHCGLIIYSDNIDVVQKWNFDGGGVSDTVLILKEVFTTPKMKLFQVIDKDGVMHYFIKKPVDSLPVQMIVHYFIEGNRDGRNDAMVSFLTQQRIYADQLRVIISDCNKVTENDLEMMDYRIYSFKKIIKQYNKCGQSVEKVKEKRGGRD